MTKPKPATAAQPLTHAWLKPAPDRRVFHEDGSPLPAEGEFVELTPWWLRRLVDEDVTIAGDEAPKGETA